MPVTEEERTALALAALGEVTDPADVGELLALEQPEAGVIDVRFACTLSAYVGWSWVVSTADLPDHQATVLEVELLPGEGSLLAPPWVPWTERLAEWRRQHPDERHPGEDEPDDENDVDEDDETRDDEDGDLDEDDLAVDDELDVLDETELDGDESTAEPEDIDVGDADDASDDLDDEDEDDDERDVRPADEDRGP